MNAVYVTLITIIALLSSSAYGRGSSRQGFNFGASVKVQNSSDRGAGEQNSKTSLLTEDQTVSPYAGFVVGDHINLGVALTFENSHSSSVEDSAEASERIERNRTTEMKSASLFSRFLFGESFFFEAGFGIYDRNVNIENQYTFGGDSFTGRREAYSVRGVGAGYHAGGGFEIEVGRRSGFYLTTSYMIRSYSLKRVDGKSSLGDQISDVTRREVAFGVSHYVD